MIDKRIACLGLLALSLRLTASEEGVLAKPERARQMILIQTTDKRPLTLDIRWCEASPWIKKKCEEDAELGTEGKRLTVPYDMQTMLGLQLFSEYVFTDKLADLEKQHLQGLPFKELVKYYKASDFFEIEPLKILFLRLLGQRMVSDTQLKAFVSQPDYLANLGLSKEQMSMLASQIFMPQDRKYLRAHLYTDHALSGSPRALHLNSFGDQVLLLCKKGSGASCLLGDCQSSVKHSIKVSSSTREVCFAGQHLIFHTSNCNIFLKICQNG